MPRPPANVNTCSGGGQRTFMLPKSSWNSPNSASALRHQISNSASLRLLLQILVCIASVVLGLRTFQQTSLVVLMLRHTEQPQEQARISPQSRVQNAPGFADIAITAGTTKKDIAKVQQHHQQQQPVAQLIPQPVAYSWNFSRSNFSTRTRVGRQKILVREWPHPDATEMMRGFDLIARVQLAHRLQRRHSWKPVIVITPTHARMFQALHLTGLMHTLSLVQAPVTWIVVEAGGRSHVTAELLKQARVHLLVHVGYPKSMPVGTEDCWIMESHMRVEGLRFVREKKLEGVVMFADDSNVQALEFFSIIQKVEWVGVVPLGILGYAGFRDGRKIPKRRGRESFGFERVQRKRRALQVHTLSQHANGTTNGWHVSKPLPLDLWTMMHGDSSAHHEMQWAGFAINAQAVWRTGGSVIRPRWLRDWQDWAQLAQHGYIDLRSLLRDESKVEMLGNNNDVKHWWIRIEGRRRHQFLSQWILDSVPEINVALARSTSWTEFHRNASIKLKP